MKKNLFVILIGITILACSLSPSVSPTQRVDVVFRSPRDMNLQPQDMPDLQETPVEEPATAALLPEAIDQDQRAYVNVTQNIYIESSVIMVPERTTREPSDVAKEITKSRNQRMRLLENGKVIAVGEKAIIIGIVDYCNLNNSTGYILVFYRNNIIVVIIACGDNVEQDYLVRIAQKIDGHVTVPPSNEEIAGAKTKQVVLNSPPIVEATATPIVVVLTPTADDNRCAKINPSITSIERKHCIVSYKLVSCESIYSICSAGTAYNIFTILNQNVYERVAPNIYCQNTPGFPPCIWKFIYTETGINVEGYDAQGKLTTKAYYEIVY